MAAESYFDGKLLYAVDWDIVMRICRSYVQARATLESAQLVPIGSAILGPRVYILGVNWARVRHAVESESASVYATIWRNAQISFDRAADELRQIIAETSYYRTTFANRQRQLSHGAMQHLNSVVDELGTTVEILKTVRDISATSVLCAAGFVSVGALGFAGVGATLKGVATWEDTGRLSAGVVKATTELVFGVIPIGMETRGVSKVGQKIAELVLAFAKPPVEGLQSHLEGETVLGGVTKGFLKFHESPVEMVVKEYVTRESPAAIRLGAIAIMTTFELLDERAASHVVGREHGVSSHPPSQRLVHSHAAGNGRLPPPVKPSLTDVATFTRSCVARYGICQMRSPLGR